MATCSVSGCTQPSHARGLCDNHYAVEYRKRCMKGRTLLSPRPKVPSLPGECWKPLHGCKHHEISNLGRIKSTHFGERLVTNRRAHNTATCGKGKDIRLHLAVARAFLDNPFNDRRVVFINGDTKDCRADNLQWIGVHCRDKAIAALRAENRRNSKELVAYMLGDDEAIGNLLVYQSNRLLSFLRVRFQDGYYIDHESVVQNALLKALSAIRRGLLRETTKLDSWFNTIAKHEAINAYVAGGGRRTQRIADLGDGHLIKGAVYNYED